MELSIKDETEELAQWVKITCCFVKSPGFPLTTHLCKPSSWAHELGSYGTECVCGVHAYMQANISIIKF